MQKKCKACGTRKVTPSEVKVNPPKSIKSKHLNLSQHPKEYYEVMEFQNIVKNKIDEEEIMSGENPIKRKLDDVIPIDLDVEDYPDVCEEMIVSCVNCEQKYQEFLKKEEIVVEALCKEHNMVKIRKRIQLKEKVNAFLFTFGIPFRFKTTKEYAETKEYFSKLLLKNNTMLKYPDMCSDGILDYDLYRGMRDEKFQIQMDVYKSNYERNKQFRKSKLEKAIYKIKNIKIFK